MDELEKKKIISYFNYNVSLEHSAIVQYLFHAYTIGEPEIEEELEEIAREEMRHLRAFAHKVVELGGKPDVDKRAAVFFHAPTPAELIKLDEEAEDMAIREYTNQYKDLKDERAKRILERAINDESAHKDIFIKLQEKLKEKEANGEVVFDENKQKIVSILNKVLQEQYAKILEHLYESFMLRFKNPHLSDELEQKAIDQMKHFGWIAEEVAEMGGEPSFDLKPIRKIEDTQKIVEETLKEEQEQKEKFSKLSEEIPDKDLQWILKRIAKREIHYTDLQEFLSRPDLKTDDVVKIISALTVGSLFKGKK